MPCAVRRQSLDGRVAPAFREADEGQRCAAIDSSTGGMRVYPRASALSTLVKISELSGVGASRLGCSPCLNNLVVQVREEWGSLSQSGGPSEGATNPVCS